MIKKGFISVTYGSLSIIASSCGARHHSLDVEGFFSPLFNPISKKQLINKTKKNKKQKKLLIASNFLISLFPVITVYVFPHVYFYHV